VLKQNVGDDEQVLGNAAAVEGTEEDHHHRTQTANRRPRVRVTMARTIKAGQIAMLAGVQH
jgi:hypothetical protein